MDNLNVSSFTSLDPFILKDRLILLIPNIVGALVVFIIGYIVYRVLSAPLKAILEKSGIESGLIKIIDGIFKVLISIFTLVMMIGQLGINVGAALAGIGVVGIAIGFASQDVLSNIIAGFFIFLDRPFRVGDYITHDNRYGCIEEITIRITRIRTQENAYVIIPNRKIINDVVIDHSANGNTRVVVKVNIAYSESIILARAAILKEVTFIKHILKNPAPDVVVQELGESGVTLLVRVWIDTPSREMDMYFKTTEAVKKALEEARIEISSPNLQIHVDSIDNDVIDKLRSLRNR
ncbi:MAG: MscS Mechanosensitive ion channel [Candidatus Taylorbacteria bacterium]|nr:MscS Mechanosensitive ion channel [Candidatus Taylorbacteria bacterium]